MKSFFSKDIRTRNPSFIRRLYRHNQSVCSFSVQQSSTGSALRLASRLLGDDDLKALDELADGVPVGCEGLSALETLQGARTPVCDPHARGALVGLSLAHGKAHVWRAALEAVCLGTRNSLEGLSRALKDDGDDDDAPLHVCGGATKSEIFLQMHADACGRAVVVGENPGSKRERNSQLQRLLSRSISTRFG